MEKGNLQKKQRSRPYILGGFVFISLLFLFLLQSSNLWKELSVDSAGSTLLLYALSSLNFFAFVIFGFIFIRSLLKLQRERRALALGSKIKTRLLIYFIAVSLLPIVAMAVFSYLFLNRALERWFTQIPENVIREVGEVQNQAVKDQIVKLHQSAKMLAKLMENREIGEEELRDIATAGNLTLLEIVNKDGKVLDGFGKKLVAEQNAELDRTLLFIRQNKFDHPFLSDGRGLDVAVVDFADGRKLVVVSDLLAEGHVSQIVESSLAEFDRLKAKQVTVRQIGLLTLGVLTFLLIFASAWAAFYIARGLTVPIKALAEGADKIAQGNLEHRVNVPAEDELALLVWAFNQMSARLEKNSAELEDRRRYIETVLQSLSTGVISFDSETRITTINKAAIQILKLEKGDFTGIKLDAILADENLVTINRLLNRAKRIGNASEQTLLRRENENGVRLQTSGNLPVALTATALPENFGEKTGVVLVIEDLSDLIAAQRTSAWSEVARRMAHEIKNPLTPIQLSAERIAKNFSKNSPFTPDTIPVLNGIENVDTNGRHRTKDPAQLTKIINESTATILREVHSLKSMVDEFSRFARLPDIELKSGNINEILRQVVSLYEDRLGDLKIESDPGENIPVAMVDAEQIKRVLVNLIDNAIEAFEPKQRDKRIFIKTFYDRARDLIVAEVSDNGLGIAPSDFQKLFQPYFSTKGRGTGLGLPIVQRIISDHHGKIKAVSNQPRGAKFIIELPVNA